MPPPRKTAMGKAGAPLKSALKDGGSKTGAKKAAGAAEDPSTGAMMEFRELFDLIDVDRSGEISKEELGNLMKILRIQVSDAEIELMFNEIGAEPGSSSSGAETGSGTDGQKSKREKKAPQHVEQISFDQFVTIMTCRVQTEYTAQDVRKSFKLFAKDMPDGEINLTDLDAALREYSGAERLSDVDRGEILKRLHVSAEGVFNYDEYIQLMLK